MEITIEKDEDKGKLNLNVVSNRVSQGCRCKELEERSKKAEVRCVELEFELQKRKDHCEALEAKFKALEEEKCAVEDELKVLRMSTEGLERKKEVGNEKGKNINKIVDLTENNEVVQLMVESEVLEREKKRTESEAEVWKDKYKSLALHLGMIRGSYFISSSQEIGDMQPAGTPSNGVFQKSPIVNTTVKPVAKARKQLTFEPEEDPSKKTAPSTPTDAKSPSVNVIDIIDSDEEPNINQNPIPDRQGNGTISVSTCSAAEKGNNSCNSCAQNNEEDLNFDEDLPFVANPKRKRSCNVVTSESESDDDDDDNMPICKLRKTHIQEVSTDQVIPDLNSSLTATISEDDKITDTVMTRRRLLPLRKCVRKSQEDKMSSGRPQKAKHQQSIPTNDYSNDDESKEDLSYSEDENISDFIVDDSDVSNGETSNKSQEICNGDVDSDSSNSQDVPGHDMDSDLQDLSDGDMDFGKILLKIQRSKTHKKKWEFEADMLAAFGKDLELCMKAVCAIYRQQTSEEQMSKGTMYHNQRGFSKFDAHRGSTLAEFLTDGDPLGGLKKSVKELQEYDPKAVELCRSLAIHYSKQLFEIFKNKEDPFFR